MNQGARPKILVFGNPIVRIDNTPLVLIGRLRKEFPKIEFKEFDPNENLEKEGSELDIIDTVEGISKVTLITEKDIGAITTQRIYSMHDFDLGYSLKLLKKMGYLKSFRIFGVPMKMSRKEAFKQLTALIRSTLF